jgi:hypothetical protein
MYNSSTTKYIQKDNGINYSKNNRNDYLQMDQNLTCCSKNYTKNNKINPMYDNYSSAMQYKPQSSSVNMFRTPYSSK